MKVTVICENTVGVPMPRGLMGEHGLAFLIEDEKTTLYDTGQGVGIINNLKILGKDVNAVDRIIISHGHYDHTGGLMQILENRNAAMPVFLHSDAFMQKIAFIEIPDGNIELPIGFPFAREDYEKKGAEFHFVDHFSEISPHIFAISDIKRPDGWKTWDIRLKCKSDNQTVIEDPFNDDLSLLIETDSGPVVLLGCAHAGIVEILDDLSEKTGHKEFFAVIGGTHLGSAPEPYIEKAIQTLKNYHIKMVGTSHCTGPYAAGTIMSHFKKEFVASAVGASFQF